MKRLVGPLVAAVVLLGAACSCGGDSKGGPDAGGVTTEHCSYLPMSPTAGAGGTVSAGALTAGAAEVILEVPVGTSLGGYSARAGFLGNAGTVDTRVVPISGEFNPSIGVLSAPRAKAVALSAGGENVLLIKIDAIFSYEGFVFDLEERLGDAYRGKIVVATSHSHSAWAQFTGHAPLKVGGGELRDSVYRGFVDGMEDAARAAIAAQRPARIGIFADTNFDPSDAITRDRRGENDGLPGGIGKDDHFFLFRIDGTDGLPIAVLPIYGVHGTLNSEDNTLASADAPGAVEQLLAEQFDNEVVVMHLNSAGADTSPTPYGGVDCSVRPGRVGDPCYEWTSEEGHARAAVDTMLTAWQAAGAAMQEQIALEMLSRSVELGPDPATFTIRGGALSYAPFDLTRAADGVIVDEAGAMVSPIDEFNAPVGAALCELTDALFPDAAMPGTQGLLTYGSCIRLDDAGEVLGDVLDLNFDVSEGHPACSMTRTTLTAIRIGDYVIGTMPGELSVLISDVIRAGSPVADDHTILIGYAQGHVGYLLKPEDWILGGYEPSVTFWGPLEAEYLAERLIELLPLVRTDAREDGTVGGLDRLATHTTVDTYPKDDPAPMAGTVPATVPSEVWQRTGTPTQAQPAAQIPRLSGIATFVWIGDDPMVQTPRIELQRDMGGGNFVAVTRRSGRHIVDNEVVIAYTPQPLIRTQGQPLTHYWTAEWQAVPWFGLAGLDGLDDRGGVPLDTFRFHVTGRGWTLDSQPFTVVPGGLAITTTRTGDQVTAVVQWHAPKGWRLLDMGIRSNLPVPVRSQQVTVTPLDGGTPQPSSTPTSDENGQIVVTVPTGADELRITDRFGNQQTVPI